MSRADRDHARYSTPEYREANRERMRRARDAARRVRGRAAPHLPGQGKGSPRAVVRVAATPAHLLARCMDAERQLRVAPRWARIEGAPPHWRRLITEE